MTYDPLLPPKHILQTEMVAKGRGGYTGHNVVISWYVRYVNDLFLKSLLMSK